MLRNFQYPFLFLISFFVKFSFQSHPFHTVVSNINSNEGINIVLFEEQKFILGEHGAFELFSNGTLNTTKEDNIFKDMKHKKEFDDYYVINNENEVTYVFPYIDGHVFIIKVSEGNISRTKIKIKHADRTVKVDSVLENNSIFLSYIAGGKGVVNIIDINAMDVIEKKETKEKISEHTFFNCRRFNELHYCLYTKEDNKIYYLTYANQTFSSEKMISVTEIEDDSVLSGIKIVNYLDSNLFGIVCDSRYHLLYLLRFDLWNNTLLLSEVKQTAMICSDISYMNILKVYEYYYLISSFDGNATQCRIYTDLFEQISFDGYELCGYNQFRISLTNNGRFINFIYSLNDIFYIDQYEIVQCDSKNYLSNSENYFDVTYTDLIFPITSMDLQKGGMTFFINRNNESLNSYISVINKNNTLIGFPDESLNEFLYHKIRIYPHTPGIFTFFYKIIITLTDTFYIPTISCSITLHNQCYDKCDSCTRLGSNNNNHCINCIEGYFFIENTTNCVNELPLYYYFDNKSSFYRKCPINCDECENNSICLKCSGGYSLISKYTNNSRDSQCILSCDEYKYIIDDVSKNFHCLYRKECPKEFPCAIGSQCRPLGNECDNEIDIVSLIEDDIVKYYEDSFVYKNDTMTIAVFDTAQTMNEDSNLTKIDIKECFEKMQKDPKEYSLILFQREKNKAVNIKDKISYTFYTKEGDKFSLEQCEDTNINFTTAVEQIHFELKLNQDTFDTLSKIGVNAFNADDNFYNDVCMNFTAENGRDILLKDRLSEYYQTISYCSDECKTISITKNGSYITCSCPVVNANVAQFSIQENIDKKDITNQNLKVIKCYKKVFNWNFMTINIGNWILITLLTCEICNFVVYIVIKRDKFLKFLKLPVHPVHYEVLQNTNSILQSITNDNSSNEYHNKIIYNNSIEKMMIYQNNYEIPVKSIMKLTSSTQLNKDINQKIPNTKINIDRADFQTTLSSDTRSFCCIFLLRVIQFNPIYISFIEKSKLKISQIYIGEILLTLTMFFFFNTFFYLDKYITHNYYKGFNVLYHIPKCVISTVVSKIVIFAVKLLIKEFPTENEVNKCRTKIKGMIFKNKYLKIMNLLHYFYFTIIFLFTVITWYYVSAFDAVFQNTQLYLLYEIFISIVIDLLLIFIIAFIVTCMRVFALKCRKEKIFIFVRFIEVH